MKELIIKVRSAILVMLTHKIALPVLRHFRRPPVFNYSELDLYMLPEGTLGSDLYLFLEKRNLPLLKYYARHDLKHVLLNYDTTDEGEVCLQSFMLGNGRVSFPVLATVVFGFITMPEHWKKMKMAFQKGSQSTSIHNWKWNEIMAESTSILRNKAFKK